MSKSTKQNEQYVKHFRDIIKTENGTVLVPDDFYVDVLPKGITKEHVEKVQEFRNAITPPLVQVIAEKTHDLMVEDDNILELTTNAFYGQEEIGVRVYRESKTVDSDGKPTNAYGQVIVSNKTNLGKHQPEYDSTLEAITECFTKSFKADSE